MRILSYQPRRPAIGSIGEDAKVLGAETVEQASLKRVEKWFKGALNFAPQDLTERVDAVLSSVKYFMVHDDPAGSVLIFCVDVMKALSTNVADDV